MGKDKFKTMMFRAQKGPISELNGCITCKLCKGYFIDATTIIECLHTFCRSCIVRYLASNKYCPICDVQVHKTKPLLNIRRDKTIQDLVYKLVPRLYQNEAKRRKVFYESNPAAKPSLSEEITTSQYEHILAPDETINIILNYYGCSSAPRYLRCPSAVSIAHLKKLIQAKYELTDHHKVDVFYNQDILNPSLSLMDVAYIYSWKKKECLDLTYKIYECRAKKLKLDCTENSESGVNKSTINNNNNWKEVQLRISENGEMSITGIQDASMLELLDATENFKSEIVINEGKNVDSYPKPEQVDAGSQQATDNANAQPKPTETTLKDGCTEQPNNSMENHSPAPCKKELPDLKFIGKTHSSSLPILTNTKSIANTKLLNSGIKMVINNAKSGASVSKIPTEVKKPTSSDTTDIIKAPISSTTTTISRTCASKFKPEPKASKMSFSGSGMPKSIELSETLNLNSELSVIPLNSSASCVSLSSCGGTTTVYSTINKSMCSTKSDESYSRVSSVNEGIENKPAIDTEKEFAPKESNNLKRKCEDTDKSAEVPAKLPKPTILNHSIGLMNLSNNHPLKKHSSKMNRNGERRNTDITEKLAVSSPNLTVSHVLVSQKPPLLDQPAKPVIINKNLSYLQVSRSSTPKMSTGQKGAHQGNVPCYMPKMNVNSVKATEKNDFAQEVSVSTHNIVPKPSSTYQNTHHTPIITPAQLPHHQNLNSLHLKQPSNVKDAVEKPDLENDKTIIVPQTSQDSKPNTHHSSSATQKRISDGNAESPLSSVSRCSTPAIDTSSPASTQNNSLPASIKAKPSTPIGYKTLRDPPKSWNSQINSQIARVNQNVKAQQLANAVAAASQSGGVNAQGRFAGDLKSVRPAKFFKGRNMPRYLGNPASGVKPMYQLHMSPDKDKSQEQLSQNPKAEKSEIKKHSIVKIDPKTLKPISEKAPETSNLSNISSNLGLAVSQNSQELRINPSSGDLKINTSSVSIFNPLKLQQNSPKNERRSPKSPHSPKVKSNSSTGTAAITTSTSSNSSSPISALSPKQQRDKTSLTFTPSNPFVPNLASPTLNPNQFLYPAGGFPSYDPRFMAACHSLWYTQRMAAAAAAGLVPPPLPHAFNLNIGLNSATTIGQQSHSPGVSAKHSTPAKSASQPPSRTSNASTPMISKTSPTQGKKLKDSSTAKNEKSLETALEKLTQSKVKELVGNKHLSNENKEVASNKDVRNGSPLHVPENSQVDTQQKKKELGYNISALEKLSQNKAIEILGSIKEDTGKKSPIVQGKDGRNSPMLNKLVAVKEKASAERPPLPLTEQSVNSTEAVKPQSLPTSKEDSQKPNANKIIEAASSLKDPQKLVLSDKESTIPATLKENDSDKDATSTELQKRLGHVEIYSESSKKSGQVQNSCSDENSTAIVKQAKPSDKLDESDKKQSANESSRDRCKSSCENVTSDKDAESELSKCGNVDKKSIDTCNTTDEVAVVSGKTDAEKKLPNEEVTPDKVAAEEHVAEKSDSGGGGEKINRV